MSVYKYHAFIFYMRPPRWLYGTGMLHRFVWQVSFAPLVEGNINLWRVCQCSCWIKGVTDGMSRVQPACLGEWKMCKKKEQIVMLMWPYIHVCHMSCNIFVMFNCTLVRSHPDSIRRYVWNWNLCNKQQDTELSVATRSMLIGRGQNGAQFKPGTRPWRKYSWSASRRPLFKNVQ